MNTIKLILVDLQKFVILIEESEFIFLQPATRMSSILLLSIRPNHNFQFSWNL